MLNKTVLFTENIQIKIKLVTAIHQITVETTGPIMVFIDELKYIS